MTPFRSRPRKDPEPEPVHKFSSTQVNLTGRPAEMVRKLQTRILPADVGTEGLEDEPHCTVFYGIHFVSPTMKLRNAVKSFGPVTITLGKTSLFSNDDADVLKIDVDSPDLHRLHAMIKRLLPTEEKYPNYIPHVTLGYLKKGRGKKYAGDTAMQGQRLQFNDVLFSGRKGYRENLPLGPAAMVPYRAK